MATLRIDGSACDVRLWPGAWASYAASIIRSDLQLLVCPTETTPGAFFHFPMRFGISSSPMLAAAGVHPKEAQELARHSDINLTLSRYTHVGLRDTAAAVGQLPLDCGASSRQGDGHGGNRSRVVVAPMVAPVSCQNLVAADDSCGNVHARTGRCASQRPRPNAVQKLGSCGRKRLIDDR